MDHQERIKQEFDRQAAAFGSSPAITDAGLTARFVEAMGVDGHGRVLDVACGPGILVTAFAETAREVVGLDLTPGMLKQAEQRCARAGRTNVTLKLGSASELPFADGEFDGVVTRLSVHHFADPRPVLTEIFRVVRPGGSFILGDVISSEDADDSELQNAIEVLRDPSHVRMLPRTELLSMVEQSGFAIEDETTWSQERGFDEWMGIASDPARVAPLRNIIRALVKAGRRAGMDLFVAADRISFRHHWSLITARRPG